MDHYLIPILFFLPAGIANAFPPIANKIPLLNHWTTPLDFNRTYRKYRIFGAHKTWRGLITGMIAGGITAFIIFGFISDINNTFFVGNIENFLLGSALGFGALFGDAIESFFKRQIGIKSGESWMFFDQIDYVIGAIIISLRFARFSLDQYAVVLLAYFGLHLLISYLGFLIGLKDKPI